jgi:hypothetical protein
MLAKRNAMKVQGPTKRHARAIQCLILAAAASGLAFGQGGRDAQSLQSSGIAKIDHWTDYVRRTGDAKSTVSELTAAEADLKTSFDIFMQQNNYAGASLSEIKIATVERLLNRWGHAIPAYQKAINLAKLAKRPDYQTTALSNMAYSELQLGGRLPGPRSGHERPD